MEGASRRLDPIDLYLWCAGAFAFIRHGAPAPIAAPTVLVARGVYRWVRNQRRPVERVTSSCSIRSKFFTATDA
jgi:hypothetical protein